MKRCDYPGCGGRMFILPAYEQNGTMNDQEVCCLLCGRPEGYTDPPSTPIRSCSRPGCLDLASPKSPEGECLHHLIVRKRTAMLGAMTADQIDEVMQHGKPGRPRRAV